MKAIIYLLQVSAFTGIFYTFYFLLLRRSAVVESNGYKIKFNIKPSAPFEQIRMGRPCYLPFCARS
ncbi:hypothetical protein ABIB62_002745 [Mucilaginibacter sp. UYP25]